MRHNNEQSLLKSAMSLMYSYLLHYYALYSHEYGDMGSTHTFDYNQDQNTAWNKPQNSSFHNTQAGML